MNMKKILVAVPFNEEQKKKLCVVAGNYECIFTDPAAVTEKMLGEVNALVGNVPVPLLKNKENLEWVQLNSSGADAYAVDGAVPEKTVLTCSTGAYGHAISEYMIAMLLAMMKRIPGYLDVQKTGMWSDLGPVGSPAGKRILLVGTGNIGLEFAKRMKVFGCTLVGIRNRSNVCPAELDEVYGTDQLKEQVSKADVIALSLPGTKTSYHLFNKEILMACKKGSYLMNVGRGTAIDTKCLLDKEVYQNFAGIWLDVCETEPLPEKDPLYFVPGLLLTPHITGGYHLAQTTENILNIAVHNMKAWKGEGEYIHLVNRKEGYSLA